MENNQLNAPETDQTQKNDDEISLIDLFAVLLKYKTMIITVTVVSMVFIIVYSIFSLRLPAEKSYLPNKYTSSANMLINNSSSSSGSSLSSLLSSSSGLSSLASLAGVNASTGSTHSSLAVYLTTSNPLLDAVSDRFDLVQRYKIRKNPRSSTRMMLKKKLKGKYDEDSGVFTVSFTDTDPVFAQSVVNFTVDWMQQRFDELGIDKNKIAKENLDKNIANSYNEILKLMKESRNIGASVANGNNGWDIPSITVQTSKVELELTAQKTVYTQLKTQAELLKVQMTSETPVFQVLERAEVPDMKSGPSRGTLTIIVTFAAFFISIFIAFTANAVENIKKDPEAMKKLHIRKNKRSTDK
jgi:uncharacterized protein involved in exopolysaccharide biosynthesis